ncbi:hypothetical protein K9N50_04825 [bacterium]|nr:hypothetical protein [bacterium]
MPSRILEFFEIFRNEARHPCEGVCLIIVNSFVPSGLDAKMLHCDLTASIEITDVYKLAGHTPYSARPARTIFKSYYRTDSKAGTQTSLVLNNTDVMDSGFHRNDTF